MPGVFRTHLYRGLGLNESMRWVVRASREQGIGDFQVVRSQRCPIDEIVGRYPEHARVEVARGVGAGLRYYVGMRGQTDDKLQIVVAALGQLEDSPWAPLALEGAAMMKDFPDPAAETTRLLPRSRRLLELLPPEGRGDFGRGLGEVCGRLYARGIPEEEAFLKGFLHSCAGPAGLDNLLGGLGRGMALASDAPALSEAARGAVPGDYWLKVEAGYEAGLAEVAALPE